MSKEKLIPELRFPEFKNEGEWGSENLGVICDVRDGTHDSPKYVSEGYPLITSKNLLIDGTMDFTNVNHLTEYDYIQINKRSKVDIGDILFGMIGTIGNPVIVKKDGFAIKNVALIKSKGQINQDFLLHQLKSDFIGKQFERVNAGGILKFIALGIIRDLNTLVPKPQEQQKIASCLSSLDEVIAAHSQKLALLTDHKKGLMQNLFPHPSTSSGSSTVAEPAEANVPKYRFKEFEKDGEWLEKTLDSLTTKISDGIHTTPSYDDAGEYYFINGNNLIDRKIVIDIKTKRVSEEEYIKHKRDLNDSTILLSINGTIGNIAVYNNESVILGKSACYINVDQSKIDKTFVIYFIQTDVIKSYFNSELTGSTIKNLSLKSIKETIIKVPVKLNEQQKIASCLSSLDALITAQAEKIEQLKWHKKGLMQGLFPRIND